MLACRNFERNEIWVVWWGRGLLDEGCLSKFRQERNLGGVLWSTFTRSSESVEISTGMVFGWCSEVDVCQMRFHGVREVDVLQLSPKGVRFANELGRRDYVTARIQKECAALPDGFQGTVTVTFGKSQKVMHHTVVNSKLADA